MRELGSHEVADPNGRVWNVGIRWLPRAPRFPGWGFGKRREVAPTDDGTGSVWPDFVGGFFEIPDSPSALLIGVLLVVVVALAWFFVFPLLFLLLDILLVLVLTATAIASRVLFRRPWIVTAESASPKDWPATDWHEKQSLEWPVVGWRNSRARVAAVAAALRSGRPLDSPR